jgi:phenylalanine ammonia-lyase
LALISARQTLNSLEILSMLVASYIYMVCQAYDLRALQSEFTEGLQKITSEELSNHFGQALTDSEMSILLPMIQKTMNAALEHTSTMDAVERMEKVAGSATSIFVDFLTGSSIINGNAAAASLASIPSFRSRVATRAAALLKQLQRDYLSGTRGPAPASSYLNRTRPVYEFVRITLGIRMHGAENLHSFESGLGVEDVTVGQNVSLIHEAIRDGKLQPIIVSMLYLL